MTRGDWPLFLLVGAIASGLLCPVTANAQAVHNGWILEFVAKDDVSKDEARRLTEKVGSLLVKDVKAEGKIALGRPIPLEAWSAASDLLQSARNKNASFIVQGSVESTPPLKERRLTITLISVSTGQAQSLPAATETRVPKLVDRVRTRIQGKPFIPQVYFTCFDAPKASDYSWEVPNRLQAILAPAWKDRFAIVHEQLAKLDCTKDTRVRTPLNGFDFVVSGDIDADDEFVQALVRVRSGEQERPSPKRFRGALKDGVQLFTSGLGNHIVQHWKDMVVE